MSDVAQDTVRASHDPHDPHGTVRLAAMVATDRPPTRQVISPVDGSVVGLVPVCTSDDVTAAVARARAAQRAWAARPMRARAAVIRRLGALVLDEQARLMDLAGAESGKARKHAFEEVAHVALTARYYASDGSPAQTTTRSGASDWCRW